MYKFNSRVRYSEVDSGGKLSLVSLLDYFQDSSTFHSEDLGVGLSYLKERNICWVMSAWQIVVQRYPELCENIVISTAPYNFKGFLGYRNFLMETDTGERLALANTIWTLMDMGKMRPVRADERMIKAYVLQEKLEMDYAPRKIALPSEEGMLMEALEVKKYHLDTNHHVNNGQYIKIAMDYLPESFEIGQMRAEYKKQARLGDQIQPRIYQRERETYTITLDGEGADNYCTVEFKQTNSRISI